MNEDEQNLLIQAYKKEKRGAIKERIHIVCMIKINGLTVTETAMQHYCDPHTVASWVQRYDKEGLAGLKDRPRSGRPPKVKAEKIAEILSKTDNITTPKQLREDIRKKYGVKYHMIHVRKTMHKFGMSAKIAKSVHINRAEIQKIRKWQRNAKRRISRLKSKGFATIVFDEAIFIDDPVKGVKYWSPKGESIVTTYRGRHDKIVACGSIATDGRQFFRTYDRFDKETVLRYLKDLVRHFGKATVIMDNAPQHKAGILKEFLNKNPNVKVIWLPTATPELSVVEKYWHQSKRDVLVSEYYATVVHMHRAVSEYFRTARPKLDAMKFICRKSLPVKNF